MLSNIHNIHTANLFSNLFTQDVLLTADSCGTVGWRPSRQVRPTVPYNFLPRRAIKLTAKALRKQQTNKYSTDPIIRPSVIRYSTSPDKAVHTMRYLRCFANGACAN